MATRYRTDRKMNVFSLIEIVEKGGGHAEPREINISKTIGPDRPAVRERSCQLLANKSEQMPLKSTGCQPFYTPPF
ncbi:unnamed protein product [Soboliphyme baturini]|uniref:Transposase n=1 Tax=Soboliphyme baturini TaxID=241478 RepID=A0A183IZN9_9BILA|nr:unnamed protein product [Soboliphyme baturini]